MGETVKETVKAMEKLGVDEIRKIVKELEAGKSKLERRNATLLSETQTIESNIKALGRPVTDEQVKKYDNRKKVVMENNRQIGNNIVKIEEINLKMLDIEKELRDCELQEVNDFVKVYCKTIEMHNKKVTNLMNYVLQFKEEILELLKDEVKQRGDLTSSMKKNGFNDFNSLMQSYDSNLNYNLHSKGSCRELINSVMNVAKFCERGI